MSQSSATHRFTYNVATVWNVINAGYSISCICAIWMYSAQAFTEKLNTVDDYMNWAMEGGDSD